MAVQLHTFDPDGDLLLVLSTPLKKTAPPPHPESYFDSTTTDILIFDVTDINDVFSPGSPETPQANQQIVHLLLSSKHMSLASPVFKAMLGENFKEGQYLRANGKVEIPVDDDPAAFVILANIVHGQLCEVPLKLDVDTLLGLVIVADKYQVREVTEFFCQTWFRELENDVPIDYSKPAYVMKWLAIAYVSRNAKTFKHLTHLIARSGDEKFEDEIQEGMPIPDSIIRKELLFPKI